MGNSSFVRDSLVRSILGWTPGVRTLLGGRVLACGCLAGTYQTWGNQVVVILDARCEGCGHESHRPHVVLWASTDGAPQVDEVFPAEPA